MRPVGVSKSLTTSGMLRPEVGGTGVAHCHGALGYEGNGSRNAQHRGQGNLDHPGVDSTHSPASSDGVGGMRGDGPADPRPSVGTAGRRIDRMSVLARRLEARRRAREGSQRGRFSIRDRLMCCRGSARAVEIEGDVTGGDHDRGGVGVRHGEIPRKPDPGRRGGVQESLPRIPAPGASAQAAAQRESESQSRESPDADCRNVHGSTSITSKRTTSGL
jgi:hypothetical protein